MKIENYRRLVKGTEKSKVLDRLNKLKVKPSFNTIIKTGNIGDILVFPTKSYFILSIKGKLIEGGSFRENDDIVINNKIYNNEIVTYIPLKNQI